jgi:hypothetical protein
MTGEASLCDAVTACRHDVVVEAVPGAGKSHLLLALCEFAPTLLLAYNRQLVLELQERMPPNGSACTTFHSLCSATVRPVRDDAELLVAVEDLETGRARLRAPAPSVKQVLIDEAQDVRALYVRLLRALGLLHDPTVRLVIVGDRNQLVYDFDPEFPASLDVLTTPHRFVRRHGPWMRVVANVSYRLNDANARFVNALFGTAVVGRNHHDCAVEVRCPTSLFALSDELADVAAHPFLLLVHRRRGNAPLRNALNHWSRAGRRIHVHGVDPNEAATGAHVRCATYWSAKGLQHDTVVVLLPAQAPRNPTYVALTRSTRRLVVVLDPRGPHAAACAAAAQLPDAVRISSDRARAVVARGSAARADASFASVDVVPRRCIDHHVMPPMQVRRDCRVETVEERDDTTAEAENDDPYGALMAVLWCEMQRTHAARAVEDMRHPCRIDHAQHDRVVELGFVGRVVSRYQTDDMLLAPDLRARAMELYARLRCFTGDLDADALAALHELAYLVEAWNGLEHVARQRPPPSSLSRDALDWVESRVPRDAFFDVRLVDADRTHARVHATTPAYAVHVVASAATAAAVGAAAVRAGLHPCRTCRLLCMQSREVLHVHATS